MFVDPAWDPVRVLVRPNADVMVMEKNTTYLNLNWCVRSNASAASTINEQNNKGISDAQRFLEKMSELKEDKENNSW